MGGVHCILYIWPVSSEWNLLRSNPQNTRLLHPEALSVRPIIPLFRVDIGFIIPFSFRVDFCFEKEIGRTNGQRVNVVVANKVLNEGRHQIAPSTFLTPS